MTEIEREFTFLVDELPGDLADSPLIIVEDNYIPETEEHPILRIRRKGEKCEITKKYPVDSVDGGKGGDSSRQVEHTIPLLRAEYDLINSLDGKRVKKRRIFYEADGFKAEVDVFLDDLNGLALVDFEFENDEEMAKFDKPGFCGADVSQEIIIAGGILAGKSFGDIEGVLRKKYKYEGVVGAERFEEVKK